MNDKVNGCEQQRRIETSVELDGAECERVQIIHTRFEYDKENLKATLPAWVKFEHGRVHVEGKLDKESLLALYLVLEDED